MRGATEYGKTINAEVIGIEIAHDDKDYAWDVYSGDEGLERYTVFPAKNYHSLSARQIRKEVATALQKIQPNAVAINGWSVPEARGALDWCNQHPEASAILMMETKENDRKRRWWKEAMKTRCLRAYSAALVGGRKQGEYLLKLGFPKDRIFLGYDVVDNDYFSQTAAHVRASGDSIRKQFNLPDKYFFVCTRFLARKNVDGVLLAYAAYRHAFGERAWGLVVAGGGEQEERLKAFAEELSLKNITWPGFVQYEELPVFYGLATAFVHPAKHEAWGLVVNEAAASGLPLLVAHPVGSRYELVRDGRNGFLFDPWNVEDITRALIKISEAPADLLAEMGLRSAQLAGQWTPFRFGQQLCAAVTAARASLESCH